MKQVLLLSIVALSAMGCRAPLSAEIDSEYGRSGDLHRVIEYRVYLPPGYEEQPWRAYPLLVWFHGAGENENGWGREHRIGEIAQQRMESGEIQPFIVLAPTAGIFTPLWFGYERRLIEETIPEVQKKFRTNGVVLGFGHSMGGLTAMMLTLRNPTLFDAVCIASPFVFDTSAWESPERRQWYERTFGAGGFGNQYRKSQRGNFDTLQDFEAWDPFSLLRRPGIARRLPPIMLTCGDRDQLGLWPHCFHLRHVMLQQGVEHVWLAQTGQGHGTINDPRLLRWLSSHAARERN